MQHPASDPHTQPETFVRQTATVVFADIAGYTSLMQADEAAALALLKVYKQAIFTLGPQYGGRVVQYYGDGCLMLFEEAAAALRCAQALQVHYRSLTPAIPVRIGLHLGEVMAEEEHIYGDSVNIASRIESMGLPGTVLLSHAVHEQVSALTDVPCVSLGNFGFKHVSQPVAVYALSSGGLPVPTAEQLSRKAVAYQIDNTPEPGAAIQILVVEDDMIVGAHISMVLAEAGYGVMGLMPSGEAALTQIATLPPDLVLMDVQLKGKLDGIETASRIYETFRVPVIFLTANADQGTFNRAKAAFPYAFINKPFQPQALLRAIELVVQRIQETGPAPAVVPDQPVLPASDHIFVRDKERMVKIPLSDIRYIEAERNYCRIYTRQRQYLLSVPMKSVEDRLDPEQFVRTHRSFLVNLSAIESLDEFYLYLGEQAVPVSKAHKDAILSRLNRL